MPWLIKNIESRNLKILNTVTNHRKKRDFVYRSWPGHNWQLVFYICAK